MGQAIEHCLAITRILLINMSSLFLSGYCQLNKTALWTFDACLFRYFSSAASRLKNATFFRVAHCAKSLDISTCLVNVSRGTRLQRHRQLLALCLLYLVYCCFQSMSIAGLNPCSPKWLGYNSFVVFLCNQCFGLCSGKMCLDLALNFV